MSLKIQEDSLEALLIKSEAYDPNDDEDNLVDGINRTIQIYNYYCDPGKEWCVRPSLQNMLNKSQSTKK